MTKAELETEAVCLDEWPNECPPQARLERVPWCGMWRKAGVISFAAALLASLGPSPAAGQSCQPVACSEILVDLPYTLDFGSDHGQNIQDRNGVGTGFTYIDPPTNGTGYIPENLFVTCPLRARSGGRRPPPAPRGQSKGSPSTTRLGVGIDAPSQVTRIEATLNDPPAGGPETSSRGGFGSATTRTTL